MIEMSTPSSKQMINAIYQLSTIPILAVLAPIDLKKDTVKSLMKKSGWSKTRTIESLRYLGYTVHKDGRISKRK